MPRPTRRTGGGHQRAAVARRPLAETIQALVVPEGASVILTTPAPLANDEWDVLGEAFKAAGLLGRVVMLVGDWGMGIIPTDQLLDTIQTPAVLADLRASVGEWIPDDGSAAAHYQGQPTIAMACSGLTAAWCPVHGDCTCRVVVNTYGDTERPAMNDPACPLHAPDSTHPVGEGNG